MDVENLHLSIPVNGIYEFFMCPICLEEITDCYTTPCCHSFCKECLFETINRRHNCPLCAAPTTQDQLMKNHTFDNLFQRIKQEKDAAAKDYVESIVKGKQHDHSNSNYVGNNNDSKDNDSNAISPIESIFAKHSSQILMSYQAYYNELETDYLSNFATLRSEYSGLLDEVKSKLNLQLNLAQNPHMPEASGDGDGSNDDDMLLPPQPMFDRTKSQDEAFSKAQELLSVYNAKKKALKASFDKSVSLLSDALEKHLKSIAPSPFLLPLACTVRAEGKPLRFDVSLKSTDTLADIQQIFIKRTEGLGADNHIVDFGNNTVFRVCRNPSFPQDFTEYKDASLCISETIIMQGSEVVLISKQILVESEQKKLCFSSTFEKGQRMNYYRCKTCNKSWICEPCVSCHDGHELIKFMMNHKPSYACCYCYKTKQCKLPNARSKGKHKHHQHKQKQHANRKQRHH